MRDKAADQEGTPVKGRARHGVHITLREWLLLSVLAAVQFTHMVDFMIIMPLGPIYLKQLDISPRQFSFLIAAYTISAGLAGLLAARFLDRFDR